MTHYEVLETFEDKDKQPVASLVRLVLETGRTHQIRVHMAHIGHPVLGDPTYGRGYLTRAARLSEAARVALEVLGRQALHAALLGFQHPVTGASLSFHSPLPGDMARLVDALRASATRASPKHGPKRSRGPQRKK